MTEVIAVMASVIAIIQISERITGLCKFYIESTTETPSDLRAILIEVSTLKTIFENLQFLKTCDHTTPALWKQLSGRDGPIEGCRRSIVELEKLFPCDFVPVPGQNTGISKKRKVKAIFATLAWPLKANRARDLLQQITHHKTTINLMLTAEST
jgi:hypothetical protein